MGRFRAGSSESDRYQDIASYIVISHCHALITAPAPIGCVEERALEECVRFLESCVDGCVTRHPLSRFYTFDEQVITLSQPDSCSRFRFDSKPFAFSFTSQWNRIVSPFILFLRVKPSFSDVSEVQLIDCYTLEAFGSI